MNHHCLSTLKTISHEGFSPSAQARLSGGRGAFSFRLSFTRSDIVKTVMAQAERMSISGVQDKVLLKLEKGELIPVVIGGEYILKPIPSAVIPFFQNDVPANEHLTMQLAAQVFKIRTAVNACVYLSDGEMAYVTKRFDRATTGERILQEDFCQLSERSEDSHGENFKYDGSYEELGGLLKQFSPAYPVEIEKLFRVILFNYIFSNGDAHLKNFSLYRTSDGDHILTPVYDLLCTSMHFPYESRTALELFDHFESNYYKANGFYGYEDFIHLGNLYGMKKQRSEKFIQECANSIDKVSSMVEHSFLSEKAKTEYFSRFKDRLKTLG